jgi:hypothetical protein
MTSESSNQTWLPAGFAHPIRVDLSGGFHLRPIESFNYALLNADESALFGCIYIDPSADAAIDAEVSWWVVDELVGTGIEAELAAFVPRWLREQWLLESVSFPHNWPDPFA